MVSGMLLPAGVDGAVMVHDQALVGYPPMHRDHRCSEGLAGVRLCEGVKVEAFAVVEHGIWRATVVGARSWLMPYVHVGHDVVIGEDCEVAGGSVIAAHCTLGRGVRIGLHTTTRPGVTIGDGARTGAGAVVVCDIPPGETWVGNPARKLGRRAAPTAGPVAEDEAERMAAMAGIAANEWAATVALWGPRREMHPCE